MLSIFNCGQGDALKISNDGCHWNDIPLYIDLGPATFTSQKVDDCFDLILTHHHADHTQGFYANSSEFIRDLYLPAYLPEVRKIYKKLSSRKIKIPFPPKGDTFFVFDGFENEKCGHVLFLNPPLDPLKLFGIKKFNDDLINNFLREYDTSVDDILSLEDELDSVEKPEGYKNHDFVRAAIQKIASRKTRSLDKAIDKFYNFDSNRLSVVFKYCNGEFSYLLTGDADKHVFERLLRSGKSIKADVLKIPHHGSKDNIDENILKSIEPTFSIFSHDNGLFGPATDPHPNIEVLNWCENNNVKMFFTNDVKKNSKVLHKAMPKGSRINEIFEFL